jgi:hypothetical protein
LHVDPRSFSANLNRSLDGYTESRQRSTATASHDPQRHQQSVAKHTFAWDAPGEQGQAYRYAAGRKGQTRDSLDQRYHSYDPDDRAHRLVELNAEELDVVQETKMARRARERLLAALRDIVNFGTDNFGLTQVTRLKQEAFGNSRNFRGNSWSYDRCSRCFSSTHLWGEGACPMLNRAAPSIVGNRHLWCVCTAGTQVTSPRIAAHAIPVVGGGIAKRTARVVFLRGLEGR